MTGPAGVGYGPGPAGAGPPRGATLLRFGRVSGTVPYEAVVAARYLRRHLPALRSCFDPVAGGKKKKPAAPVGSFDAELAIDATGKVTSASIAGLSDRRARSCALAVLERIEFMEAKAGGTIRFPLIVEIAP